MKAVLASLMSVRNYKRLLDRLEDIELAGFVYARANERRIAVDLDDL